MRDLLEKLWRDDDGCVAATEWMLVASVLTLSALASLAVLHYASW